MGRLFRVNRFGARPATDDEADRVRRDVAEREAQQHAEQHGLPIHTRVAEQRDPEPTAPSATPDLLPSVIPVQGFARPLVTSSLSPRRQPVWEAWAADRGVPVIAWEITHYPESDGRVLHGFAYRHGGADHVFVNRVQVNGCPIRGTRAVLEHELEHCRRGLIGTGSPFAVDAFSEAACEDAAAGLVLGLVRLFETKCPTAAPVNAALCQQCYRTSSDTCLQPTGILDQVRAVLTW
jgi:hypothetical protein